MPIYQDIRELHLCNSLRRPASLYPLGMASVLTTDDHTEWGAPPPDQVIAHTNLYWTYQAAPGRTAGTVATKDVDFGGVS